MKHSFMVASAALLMAGIVLTGAVFADDNITEGQIITDEESVNQDVNIDQETTDSSDDMDSTFEEDNTVDDENISEGLGTGNTDGEVSDDSAGSLDKLMTAELSGQYLTVVLNDAADYLSASAAIWSEVGGQDDLVWYPMTKQADGTFMISVNLGLHGSAGVYHIHVYSGNNYIAGESVVLEALAKPEMVIATIEGNEGSVVVSIRNASGYTNVKVAVWGVQNGQNDLKWYGLSDSGNGTVSAVIDLAKHGESGTFYFHAYGSANGKERFLDGKEYDFTSSPTTEPSVTTELEGQILTVKAENTGSYSDVKAAVWSETGGQDDLAWYKLAKDSAGNYMAEINLASHKSTGKFIIHVYGGKTCIGGGIVTLDSFSQPALTVEKAAGSENRIILTIENAYGFSNVKAAIWGKNNGQNDLKWYILEDRGNGIFETEVDLLSHGEAGTFYIHAYGKVNGAETFIDGKELEIIGVDIPEPKLESVLNGQIAEITLSQAQGYSSAVAAVWSEANGQDDLVWYPMTGNSDGSFIVKVNLGMHRSTGKFNIHVYSGNDYVAGNSLELEAVEASALYVVTDADNSGKVTVSVGNAYGFSNVRAAIWGSKNYQNDLKWYSLKDAGDGLFTADIDLSAHGEEGYYYFHAYGEYAGKTVFIDGLVTDPAVPDVNEEISGIDESAAISLAQRSGDEEMNILFIGNSITRHGIADFWWGYWGMAATEADKDYVHVVANAFNEYVNTDFDIVTFVDWEAEGNNRNSLLPLLDDKLNESYDLIVIELGDNIASTSKTVAGIQADYEALFSYCRAKAPQAKIVAVGNFLISTLAEAAKSAACANTGVPLIDLNDIRTDSKYQCGLGTLVDGDDESLHEVSGVAVAEHPGNYGMDKIGKRVIRAALAN